MADSYRNIDFNPHFLSYIKLSMLRSYTKSLKNLALIFGIAVFCLSSCIAPQSIIYFQDGTEENKLMLAQEPIDMAHVPLIQPNDLLSIIVGSLSAEANEIFMSNQIALPNVSYPIAGGAGTRQQPIGYLVDQDGNIEFPLIGKVNLLGLTTQMAADTIRHHLQNYLKEATVIVRIANFKVSILGEVGRPAVYVVPEEKITITELISLAGDLTIYGRRDNVLIIREENGERTYARVDLTSRNLFKSPYYYLHKNDVVYIEPVKARMTYTDRTMQVLPLVLSSISVIAIILTRIF